MPPRTSKWKTRHGDVKNEENSPHCSSARLDTEVNCSTEEQVDEMSLKIEKEVTRKMKDLIRKSVNKKLKALYSLSENPPCDDRNGLGTMIMSDG